MKNISSTRGSGEDERSLLRRIISNWKTPVSIHVRFVSLGIFCICRYILISLFFITCMLCINFVTCSRLSVSGDDRKSERAASGISCERDPGVKRRGMESL